MARAFGADRSLVILDPMLRVVDVAPLDEVDRVLGVLRRLPRLNPASAPSPPAPILTLAHVFEPELCAHLIACFERDGGKDSGFMQDQGGRSVENFDDSWKRRRDFHLTDAKLIANLQSAHRAKDLPGDQKGVPDAPDPDRARPRRALRFRDRRPFRSSSRRHRESRSRIAGSPSRSISTRISRAARFRFPSTAPKPSRPRREPRSCSPLRFFTRCRG